MAGAAHVAGLDALPLARGKRVILTRGLTGETGFPP